VCLSGWLGYSRAAFQQGQSVRKDRLNTRLFLEAGGFGLYNRALRSNAIGRRLAGLTGSVEKARLGYPKRLLATLLDARFRGTRAREHTHSAELLNLRDDHVVLPREQTTTRPP
jgi:hypothetical protein